MKKVQYFALFLLAVGLVYAAARFAHRETQGFKLWKIKSNFPYEENLASPPLTLEAKEHLNEIFSQEFRYLGRGAQVFAFASADEKYVLKFFYIPHIAPPFWVNLPLPSRYKAKAAEKIAEFSEKRNRDFDSYQLAMEELREETGLVYLHLTKSKDLRKKVRLYDRIGVAHDVDLDNTLFILQKKIDLLYPSITTLIEQGKTKEAKGLLKELVAFLKGRCQKGLGDTNPNLRTNFGVLDGKIIQLDIGRFYRDETKKNRDVYRAEIGEIAEKMNSWLEENHVELKGYFNGVVDEID